MTTEAAQGLNCCRPHVFPKLIEAASERQYRRSIVILLQFFSFYCHLLFICEDFHYEVEHVLDNILLPRSLRS